MLPHQKGPYFLLPLGNKFAVGWMRETPEGSLYRFPLSGNGLVKRQSKDFNIMCIWHSLLMQERKIQSATQRQRLCLFISMGDAQKGLRFHVW